MLMELSVYVCLMTVGLRVVLSAVDRQ